MTSNNRQRRSNSSRHNQNQNKTAKPEKNMPKFNVKDNVVLRENETKTGMIVNIDKRTQRVAVLWDSDWHTGRTFYYNPEDLRHAR